MPECCKNCTGGKGYCGRYEDCKRWIEWFYDRWESVSEKVKKDLRRRGREGKKN